MESSAIIELGGSAGITLDDIKAGVTLRAYDIFQVDMGVFDTLDEAITELKKYESGCAVYSNRYPGQTVGLWNFNRRNKYRNKFSITEYMIEERDYYDDEDDEEYEPNENYDYFSEMRFGVYDEDTRELIGCADNLEDAVSICEDYELENYEEHEDAEYEDRYAYIELL